MGNCAAIFRKPVNRNFPINESKQNEKNKQNEKRAKNNERAKKKTVLPSGQRNIYFQPRLKERKIGYNHPSCGLYHCWQHVQNLLTCYKFVPNTWMLQNSSQQARRLSEEYGYESPIFAVIQLPVYENPLKKQVMPRDACHKSPIFAAVRLPPIKGPGKSEQQFPTNCRPDQDGTLHEILIDLKKNPPRIVETRL